MKGDDQCPKCASRSTVETNTEGGYLIRACVNCKTTWEPFEKSVLLDTDDRYSQFTKPCNNCAFRPGSPERSDPEKWEHLLSTLGWYEGAFYCHKGVPINMESEDGFDYPKTKDGKHDIRRLRMCSGYVHWLKSSKAVAKKRLKELAWETQQSAEDSAPE